MRYIDFRQKFQVPIFTSQDIRLLAKDITPSQLTSWQKQEFITKVTRGVYVFNDQKSYISPEELSSIVREPSYISLESALFKYNLIPEVVFATTCVTSRNLHTYKTYLGSLIYQHLKPDLYFGYEQVMGKFRPYLLAQPEKAILDFFYLHPQYQDIVDVEEMRLNTIVFQELDHNRLDRYAKLFPVRVQKMIRFARKLDA